MGDKVSDATTQDALAQSLAEELQLRFYHNFHTYRCPHYFPYVWSIVYAGEFRPQSPEINPCREMMVGYDDMYPRHLSYTDGSKQTDIYVGMSDGDIYIGSTKFRFSLANPALIEKLREAIYADDLVARIAIHANSTSIP